MSWSIERLAAKHDRTGFCCGKQSLDDFLARYVSQYEKRNVGRTYVLVRDGEPKVYGYFTLAAADIEVADLPPELAKKLPKHPIPALLLGRLAVDQSVRGQGLGGLLLKEALVRGLASRTCWACSRWSWMRSTTRPRASINGSGSPRSRSTRTDCSSRWTPSASPGAGDGRP